MNVLRKLFGSDDATYARHFKHERNILQTQLELIEKETGREITLDALALEIFRRSGLAGLVRPVKGANQIVYSPAQLRNAIRIILTIPKPLGSYLILYELGPVIKAHSIPGDMQGDLLIAMEQIRAIEPDLADSAAEFLAHSLCMMSAGLKSAREVYTHIGAPYRTDRLSPQEIQRLLAEGFVSTSEVEGNRLRQDIKIQRLTRKKLFVINEEITKLITLSDT